MTIDAGTIWTGQPQRDAHLRSADFLDVEHHPRITFTGNQVEVAGAYGPAAVLKNAIDWVYPEWNRKAAGFVSYGSALGARSVQQLRETAIELQLAPVHSGVYIPVATLWAHYQGGNVDAGLAQLEAPAGRMIDDLLWWTAALKMARASAS